MAGMGFLAGLEAVGAGLGQFAQQLQQQKAQQERSMMLKMELQRFQQQQQQFQQQQQTADIGSTLLGGGGFTPAGPGDTPNLGGMSGLPGSAPQAATMPDAGPANAPAGAPAAGPAGGGERAPSGGGVLSYDQIAQLASTAGFSADAVPTITALSMAESGGNPMAFNPNDPSGGSFGLTQINGVHPGAQSARGNPQRAMQLAFDISKGGTDFSPWSTYTSGAYKKYLRPGGAAPAMGDQGGSSPQTPSSGGDGSSGGDQGQATTAPPQTPPTQGQPQAAGGAAPDLGSPPQPPNYEQIRSGIIQQAQQEAQRRGYSPDAARRAAAAAIPKAFALAREDYRDQVLQWNQQKAQRTLDRTEARQEREAQGGGQIIETDKGPMRIPKGSNKAAPIDLGGARMVGSKAGEGAAQNIIAFKGGERTFEGSARSTPQGWVNAATGQTIDADRIEITGKGGSGASGGRAGAQVQRQLISAREILSDLQNVARLPITSNRGIFGGRQQGPSLTAALKENLAEQLTSEDAELTNSALASLQRELSVVVSPVYGGHWAADSFGALALKPGQTYLVKLYNLARMRQTAENALEGIENTDWVGAEQKKYSTVVRGEIAKAIPWTPGDVLTFREHGKQGESFSDFVKAHNIGASGQQGGGAQEGDTATNPQTGEKRVYRDGKWVPVQAADPGKS